MASVLYRLGGWTFDHRRLVVAIWVAVVLGFGGAVMEPSVMSVILTLELIYRTPSKELEVVPESRATLEAVPPVRSARHKSSYNIVCDNTGNNANCSASKPIFKDQRAIAPARPTPNNFAAPAYKNTYAGAT